MRILVLFLVALGTQFGRGDETASLRMRFVYSGKPPQIRMIEPHLDKDFCGRCMIPDEHLIVDPFNRGIKNVVVYLDNHRGKIKLPPSKSLPMTLDLQFRSCRFKPHVLAAKKGDSIHVIHRDAIGHNANFRFLNNHLTSIAIPSGKPYLVKLHATEPTAVPVSCNIHPWMNAHLFVLDHRFIGISTRKGFVEVKGLPVGVELPFRVWHETMSMQTVVIKGTATHWERSRFSLRLSPGVNDLGTISVKPVD